MYGQDRASILCLRSSGRSLNYLKWSQTVKFTSVIKEEIKNGGEINNTSSWNLIPVISNRRGGTAHSVLKSFPYISRISCDPTHPNWWKLYTLKQISPALRCVVAKSKLRSTEIFSTNHHQPHSKRTLSSVSFKYLLNLQSQLQFQNKSIMWSLPSLQLFTCEYHFEITHLNIP